MLISARNIFRVETNPRSRAKNEFCIAPARTCSVRRDANSFYAARLNANGREPKPSQRLGLPNVLEPKQPWYGVV
jgi:hypothetical protein